MLKNNIVRFSFGVALAVATSASTMMQAQAVGMQTLPSITTGGDPQPVKPGSVLITILPMLITLAAG